MKLFKYGEFITESHLEFLLEANVDFSKDFIGVLKKVDSPIAKQLIDIEGTDVDINQIVPISKKNKKELRVIENKNIWYNICTISSEYLFDLLSAYNFEKIDIRYHIQLVVMKKSKLNPGHFPSLNSKIAIK